MSPEPQQSHAEPTPIEIGPVIEFGSAPARPSRRRLSLTRWAHDLARDRRVVPLTAVLGGVALFASLTSEWQVTVLDSTVMGQGQAGLKSLAVTVADLGAWGSGYLAGLFLLVTATVLAFFGPPPGRRYARLAGLSTGGVLAGLLVAVGSELGDSSRVLGPVFQAGLTANQFQISYGRGLWCAVFGVAAVLISLVLAGRQAPAETEAEAAAPMWSWRRSRTDSTPDEDPGALDEPFELTVSPAKPFTTEDRDEPS